MKKTFINSLAILLFIVGITILSTNNSEAAVTANINASSTSVKVGDPSVDISFGSDGADSCSITLNGSVISTSKSGNLTLSTSTPGTYTYKIECKHTVVSSSVYFKLCGSQNNYYTSGTAGYLSSGQKVTGAIWCDRFYEYTVCGSSDNPNTYSGLTEISVTPSVCAAHQ